MKPPTIHELLEDPVYRAFVKKVPYLPENLRIGEPWQVWARTKDSPAKWRGARFSSYPGAWGALVKAVRNTARYDDVAIVSRRATFGPPEGFHWSPLHYTWCSRCRRPSSFTYRPRHHALRDAPVLTEEDAQRCFYCGVRRIFVDSYRTV